MSTKRLEEVLDKVSESNDPKAEFAKDASAIEQSLKIINKGWADWKKKIEKQLKDNPENWGGIGRGSETSSINRDMRDLAMTMNSLR